MAHALYTLNKPGPANTFQHSATQPGPQLPSPPQIPARYPATSAITGHSHPIDQAVFSQSPSQSVPMISAPTQLNNSYTATEHQAPATQATPDSPSTFPKHTHAPIIPGYKADPLQLRISPKFITALERLDYVSYAAVALSARMKASFDNSSESRVVAELSALLSKPSDFSKDQNISIQDWFTVSTAVEREMRKFHGEERANALHKHHMVVFGIARRWSWAVAVNYDIEQRQLTYMEKSHDYSTIDPTSVTAISGRHMLQACQGPQAQVSPTKRPQTQEPSTPAAKRQRRCDSCFRCGRAGHLPVSCSATMTTAGKPVAAFAPNTKNSQAL